jgi:hypothetical protein
MRKAKAEEIILKRECLFPKAGIVYCESDQPYFFTAIQKICFPYTHFVIGEKYYIYCFGTVFSFLRA